MRKGLLEYAEALADTLERRDPAKPFKRKELAEIFQALVEGGVCSLDEIEEVKGVFRRRKKNRGQQKYFQSKVKRVLTMASFS